MFLNKVLGFGFGLMSFALFSQEKIEVKKDSIKENELDEVVVTATRTRRQLSSLPMPVTLVSKEQIRKTGSVRLRDILLEQTGIVMVADRGNSEGIQMQGVAADYTLIMIDGVPIVGRVAGNIDLNRLTINNIKQIEIVKGPSSSLYGSEAMGGVINIITEQPRQGQFKGDFHVFSRGGARNELDVNANVMSKKDKLSIVAGINLNSSGGYDFSPESPNHRTANPHQNFTGNLTLGYDFSDKFKALVTSRYYNQEQNSLLSDNIQTDWNVNAKLTHKISDIWDVDYTFYGTLFRTESIFNGEIALFDRSLFRPEIRTKVSLGNSNSIIAGVGVNFDALERSAFDGKKRYNAQYVFGQFDFNPIEDLNIVLGARFDSHNKYESAFSPKISASYKINDWITTKGSVGYGFKAPDFRQLYYNFRNTVGGYAVFGTQTIHEFFVGEVGINFIEKELKPESSIGYNFGFQLKPLSNLKMNINLFRNDIQDLIDVFDVNADLRNRGVDQLKPQVAGLGDNTRIFSYRNINEVYTQGVEVEVDYRINQNFKFLGGYQFLDTGDKEQEEKIKKGEVFFDHNNGGEGRVTLSNYFGLVNRSKHTGNAKLFYENFEHRFSANVRALYRSKYALSDTNNSQGIIDDFDKFVDGNIQVNTAIEKELFSLFKLQVGVDNLFNERGTSNAEKFENNESVLLLGRTYYGRVTINF